MKQKRLPFRRKQTSESDQILRDRKKFEKQNMEIAHYIVEHPEKVDNCPPILEWCAMVINPPLEDDGAELRIVGES